MYTRLSSWSIFLLVLLDGVSVCAGFFFQLSTAPSTRPTRSVYSLAITQSNEPEQHTHTVPLSQQQPGRQQHQQHQKLLIHWKGEDVEGYTLQFRHVEFRGALAAILGEQGCGELDVFFHNALQYTGNELSPFKSDSYNQAMQYLQVPNEIPVSACIQAAQRCSLIHALYQVVAETVDGNYDDLCVAAMQNGDLDDLQPGNRHADHTWCFRVRHYGDNTDAGKERRYNDRARSMTLERQALQNFKPLLLTFGGKVDLKDPDCKIYVFDGLINNRTVLARRVARGPRWAILNPNTRICVTNTPLCPRAAFALCNVARIRVNSTVLDPFAGSCATLLAAAMIDPTTKTVGIEIAHDGLVCRDDIRKDFSSRNLTQPEALLLGDASDFTIRAQARINGQPFDCIIADPPYGIRESTGFMDRPVDELFQMIMTDRDAGTPLLRKGGRLVVFLPHQTEEESFDDIMPSAEQMKAAGLRCDLTREQPLNDILSRWLVSFVCID